MAEVLSQSQIDALLNTMQSGDGTETSQPEKIVEKNYRKYDFHSPKKFTKDRLKVIKGIYDNYSRIAASQLNSILRVNCEMEVVSVEEQRYYEFSNALAENDIMMQVNLALPDQSKNPPMLIYINQSLMVNMIDRMLGGGGTDADIDSNYVYTDIELSLYKKMMNHIIGVTKDAWSNYIKIEVQGQRLEDNPGLFQEISLDEPVAIIIIEVSMQSIKGRMHVCIPGNLLTNVFSIMDKRKHIEGAYDNGIENAKEIIHSKMRESALQVSAQLGQVSVNLSDVYNLKVGDVIDLNKQKNSPIALYVQDELWFEGQLGVFKKNVAVKIEKRMNEEV